MICHFKLKKTEMKNIKVSFREGMGKPIRDVDLYKFLTTDHYKTLIEEIRAEEDKEARQDLKKGLGCVTPSGRFNTAMKENELVEHSGLLGLDIDDADNFYTAESMKKVCSSLSQTEFCCYSASGKGVFALIRIDPERHLESFKYIQHFFQDELNITIDGQCKNISRLRFATYDPDYYYNDNAEMLDIGDWKEPVPEMPPVEGGMFDTDKPTQDFLQYCRRYDTEFTEGNRNRFIFNKACKAREKFGLSKDQAESILRRYVVLGFPPSELTTTINSAYRV